jgi:hypothetical protein
MEETNVNKIRVPKAVLDGLEAVRQSGLTNMLDRPVVARLAEEMGFEDAAEWVGAHRKEYAEGIFRGFEAEEDE